MSDQQTSMLGGNINTSFGGVPFGGGVSLNSYNMQMDIDPLAGPPCARFGHRFAWLVYGGMECTECGARR